MNLIKLEVQLNLNKRGTLVLLLFFFNCSHLFAQIEDYFSGNRSYHYNAIYIDSLGDTITNEILTVIPTDKRWFFQPGKQMVVKYIFNTDTSQYKNYRDPDEIFREMDEDYHTKKNKYRLTEKTKTGGYCNDDFFYLHPPRTNQYRRLSYSVHPFFNLRSLEKKHDEFTIDFIKLHTKGRLIQKFVIDSIGTKLFNDKKLAFWKVFAESTLDPVNEYYEQNKWRYKSSFDALFCEEYGFIEMNYEFEIGVKIQFKLFKIEEL